jgi:GH18 family chitinase
MAVTNNKQAPSEFRRVGYFEAWNGNRKCLHMDVTDIPRGAYTHVHYAFADIDFSYNVGVAKNQDQFDKFKQAKGYKRILAFGGWAFSTEPATADIFRAGVRPGNRERLSSSLVDFIVRNDLDGIDFDWEYPGVPDMNWLPPSSPREVILLRVLFGLYSRSRVQTTQHFCDS